MAQRTVEVELKILGRNHSLSCPRDERRTMLDAATKLDADLKEYLGDSKVSNRAVIDNLVALALEYLTRHMHSDAERERESARQRVEDATRRLEELEASLSES